jgi:hypothetical protein
VRPLAVLTAIIFGSAAAITFGLSGVLVIYLVLKGRHPELLAEFGPLLRSSAQFAVLAVTSGLSLYSTLKGLSWRWIAQTMMWFALMTIIMLYWPR